MTKNRIRSGSGFQGVDLESLVRREHQMADLNSYIQSPKQSPNSNGSDAALLGLFLQNSKYLNSRPGLLILLTTHSQRTRVGGQQGTPGRNRKLRFKITTSPNFFIKIKQYKKQKQRIRSTIKQSFFSRSSSNPISKMNNQSLLGITKGVSHANSILFF